MVVYSIDSYIAMFYACSCNNSYHITGFYWPTKDG